MIGAWRRKGRGSVSRAAGFSLLEVVLGAVFLVGLTAMLTVQLDPMGSEHWRFRSRYPHEEWLDLEKQYGPGRNSIGVDEWVIRDALQDRRGGVFLDVGASHYQLGSNTYYLEKALDWSGIAVEARAEFGAEYAANRPKTRFVAMFASDVPDRAVQLFVPASNLFVASQSKAEAEEESGGEELTVREVPTTTLDVVLEQAGVERIDFLNMDIEGAEPQALAGFDVGRYQPGLVCIEAHLQTRQFILDYFQDRGYRLVGKYLRVDPTNLYFMPR
jgi:FkbM family methyltransferase